MESDMRTVRRGSRGPSVRLLQERLDRHGFDPGPADGIFGSGTDQAVEQFQAAQDLVVDGVVGPRTWALLMVEVRAEVPPDVREEARDDDLRRLNDDKSPGAAVVRVALAQVGHREVPDGSNGGPELAYIVDEGGNGRPPSAYYQYWGVSNLMVLAKMPSWCMIFVSWCLKEGLGAETWKEIPFGDWLGRVADVESWAKDHGCWLPASAETQPGDVFCMGRAGSASDIARTTRAGHCGIVVVDDGTHVETVEGNVSNMVARRRRAKSSLRGFVRWIDVHSFD